MLDPHFVRDHVDEVRAALAKRRMDVSLDPFLDLDRRRRELLGEVESLKQARNARSKEIGAILKSGGDAAAAKEEVRAIGERVSALESELGSVEEGLSALLHDLPNLPHASVPEGAGEADNREESRWGEPPVFDFEPQAHDALGEALGILDLARAAKMSGARFALYFGAGARLARALIRFMLDLHTKEHGYTEVLPPFLVHEAALFGTGQLPKFREDLFHVAPLDHFLIPTAEVPLTNIHAGEILDEDALPIAYCAYTPCFRSEAGSYGKDVRGLIRQHQFDKVELVRFASAADSYDQLERLTGHAEEVLRRLELPYRKVTLCGGDLGFGAAKTYDLEVWLPSQGTYREISSCSNFEGFQARRARIRYRTGPKGKPAPVHTLNGSGLAVGRTWLALLENFQQKDGTVALPDALRPFMDGETRIVPRG